MNRVPMTLLAAFIALVAAVPTAARAETPDEILAKADKLTNGWDDQYMKSTMTIIDIDGSKKSYIFSIAQKGDKRMVRFESGELKGMATLILNRDSVYAYLPGFKKIRRVAAHNMNQSFAGSDFSNDDMAFTSWTNSYVATMDHEDATPWYLACTPRPGGVKPPHARAIARIDKKNYQLMGYEFFDEGGQKVKTFDNNELTDWGGGKYRNKVIVVTDNRTGHKTRLDLIDAKFNAGIKDSIFTERELEWGK
jgi:outer membrane lipoprotein-sorting protein